MDNTKVVSVSETVFITEFPEKVISKVRSTYPSSTWNYNDIIFLENEYRIPEGIRWKIRGNIVGSAEVWLERHKFGTLVHFFMHGIISDQLPEQKAKNIIKYLRSRVMSTLFYFKLTVEK